MLVNCQSTLFTNQITPVFVKPTPKAFCQILHLKKETTVEEKKRAKPKVNGAAEKKKLIRAHTSPVQPAVSWDSAQESTSEAEQQWQEKSACPTSLFS